MNTCICFPPSLMGTYTNGKFPGKNFQTIQPPLVHNVIDIVRLILADDMANISLDVHTFIAQNLSKYRFQSSIDYTIPSLRVSTIIL